MWNTCKPLAVSFQCMTKSTTNKKKKKKKKGRYIWELKKSEESPWGRRRTWDGMKEELTSILLFMGFPGGWDSKESARNAGEVRDMGLIPESGRSPGEGHGNLLQYSYSSILTTVFYCVAQGTLLNAMWKPGWEEIWGRIDTCICMAESLCCLPETTKILFISSIKLIV